MKDRQVLGESFSLEQIKKLADEALVVLMKHHHKTIYFDSCPECQLKKYILKIQETATEG
jgi:hypothetical protein